MLFLIISTPRPTRPSRVVAARRQYWEWMRNLQDAGVAKAVYSRVGRGAVALFDVTSHETLHQLMNEWADMIPAHFDVYPLLETQHAQAFLQAQPDGRP